MKKTLAIALTFMMGLVIFTACEDEGSLNDDSNTTQTTQNATVGADEVAFSSLNWCWGGYNGSGAKLVPGCAIGGLKCSNSGMSYSWKQGGCETLGAANSTEASCLACLFVKQGGRWSGGKIDWISTSRRTRDFLNPNSGYNGWDPNAIKNASEFAFVIVKGSKRSNVIYFKR